MFFSDTKLASLINGYYPKEEIKEPITKKIIGKKKSSNVTPKTAKASRKKVLQLFEITDMYNLNALFSDRKIIRESVSKEAEYLILKEDRENELRTFHEAYIMPIRDGDTSANIIQHVFLATLIVMYIKNHEYFQNSFFTKSDSKLIPKPTDIEQVTTGRLMSKVSCIMNKIGEEYLAENNLTHDFWEKDFEFDFPATEAYYKQMQNEINEHMEKVTPVDIELYSEEGAVEIREAIYNKMSYWQLIVDSFSELVKRGIFSPEVDKQVYNEYERKLEDIVYWLSILSANRKIAIFKKHAGAINRLHKSVYECLDSHHSNRKKKIKSRTIKPR